MSFRNGLALLPQQFVLLCTGDVRALKLCLVVSRLLSPILFLNIRTFGTLPMLGWWGYVRRVVDSIIYWWYAGSANTAAFLENLQH